MFSNIYAGRRILVTGHTGFKGSWLATWLAHLGAHVAGYSIGIPSQPSNFEVLRLDRRLHHYAGDVRNRKQFQDVLNDFRPEMIFHLAAQSLVRRSYDDPATTFETNAVGTMNVLESIRLSPDVRAAVIITSDKCYRNVEWIWGYRENDVLGGEDPYSASKACAEMVSYAYIKSYFKANANTVAVATARAGNVIGGGDWAEDRIIPDCIRSWSKGEGVRIRNPQSTRPWQHVLEPLSGYLHLGARLWQREKENFGGAYNFGPDANVNHPVSTLIQEVGAYWPGAKWVFESPDPQARPEAKLLKLCCDKALMELKWRSVLTFSETARLTGEWYNKFYTQSDADMYVFTLQQIDTYAKLAQDKEVAWTR